MSRPPNKTRLTRQTLEACIEQDNPELTPEQRAVLAEACITILIEAGILTPVPQSQAERLSPEGKT